MAAFNNKDTVPRTTYSPLTIQKIKHDHADIVKKNAAMEKTKADENLREMSVYLAMGEEHDRFPIGDLKYTSALRSKVIESNVPAWGSYICTYFGQAPLSRYPRSQCIDLRRVKYLQVVNTSIVVYIMEYITSKTPIATDDKEEWMFELCKQANPVLSYIPTVEKFTNGEYPSLVFEAHSFEIPYENNTKIYVILANSSKIAGSLVIDYFFYYF